jgi:hypothetical protein
MRRLTGGGAGREARGARVQPRSEKTFAKPMGRRRRLGRRLEECTGTTVRLRAENARSPHAKSLGGCSTRMRGDFASSDASAARNGDEVVPAAARRGAMTKWVPVRPRGTRGNERGCDADARREPRQDAVEHPQGTTIFMRWVSGARTTSLAQSCPRSRSPDVPDLGCVCC